MYTFSVIYSNWDQTNQLINIVWALNLNIVGNILYCFVIINIIINYGRSNL